MYVRTATANSSVAISDEGTICTHHKALGLSYVKSKLIDAKDFKLQLCVQ